MNNDIDNAIKKAISNIEHIYGIVSSDIQRSLDIVIKALEEAQLDIKLLKMDLPELFRPSYDGGYLRGEEE